MKVALPVSVSREVERFAESHGAEIVWTKLSTSHLMEVAANGGIDLAASQEGGYIFPGFLPAYDATATLVNLLALLAASGLRLSKVVESAPRPTSPTRSWRRRGSRRASSCGRWSRRRPRSSCSSTASRSSATTAGPWCCPTPRSRSPTCGPRAASDGEADALAQEYARRIRHMIR